MKNKKRQRCARCNGWVAIGAGEMERRENPDGGYRWIVWHADGECEAPGEVDSAGGGNGAEPAVWAVHGSGRTPEGNETRGVRLVEADVPHVGYVPLNLAAREIADDDIGVRQPPRTPDDILADYGHTRESFDGLGRLRVEWMRAASQADRAQHGFLRLAELVARLDALKTK